VLPLLNGDCEFMTCDGAEHTIAGQWDMIIAFPPCTFLTAASAVRLFGKDGTIKDAERYQSGLKAASLFSSILNASCERIAVENPTPLKCFCLPPYSQSTEPYYHGDPWKKRTCLWLRGLPPLMPTDIVQPEGLWVGSTSGRRDAHVYSRYAMKSNRNQKRRSKTFPGIARAMAEQWGGQP
jgi:hypothetical protein